MEPMRPDDRARILEDSPLAEPGDVEEYERLLSRRFTIDPDLSPAPGGDSELDRIEARLEQLQRKLFPERHAEIGR